jgi:hypothetical protein
MANPLGHHTSLKEEYHIASAISTTQNGKIGKVVIPESNKKTLLPSEFRFFLSHENVSRPRAGLYFKKNSLGTLFLASRSA